MASFFSCLVDCAGFDLLDYPPADEPDVTSRTRDSGTNTHSRYAAGRKVSKGRRISDKGGEDAEAISVYSSSTGKLVSPSACPPGPLGSSHRSSSKKACPQNQVPLATALSDDEGDTCSDDDDSAGVATAAKTRGVWEYQDTASDEITALAQNSSSDNGVGVAFNINDSGDEEIDLLEDDTIILPLSSTPSRSVVTPALDIDTVAEAAFAAIAAATSSEPLTSSYTPTIVTGDGGCSPISRAALSKLHAIVRSHSRGPLERHSIASQDDDAIVNTENTDSGGGGGDRSLSTSDCNQEESSPTAGGRSVSFDGSREQLNAVGDEGEGEEREGIGGLPPGPATTFKKPPLRSTSMVSAKSISEPAEQDFPHDTYDEEEAYLNVVTGVASSPARADKPARSLKRMNSVPSIKEMRAAPTPGRQRKQDGTGEMARRVVAKWGEHPDEEDDGVKDTLDRSPRRTSVSTSLRHVRLSEDGKRVTVHSSEKGVDHELALNELVEVQGTPSKNRVVLRGRKLELRIGFEGDANAFKQFRQALVPNVDNGNTTSSASNARGDAAKDYHKDPPSVLPTPLSISSGEGGGEQESKHVASTPHDIASSNVSIDIATATSASATAGNGTELLPLPLPPLTNLQQVPHTSALRNAARNFSTPPRPKKGYVVETTGPSPARIIIHAVVPPLHHNNPASSSLDPGNTITDPSPASAYAPSSRSGGGGDGAGMQTTDLSAPSPANVSTAGTSAALRVKEHELQPRAGLEASSFSSAGAEGVTSKYVVAGPSPSPAGSSYYAPPSVPSSGRGGPLTGSSVSTDFGSSAIGSANASSSAHQATFGSKFSAPSPASEFVYSGGVEGDGHDDDDDAHDGEESVLPQAAGVVDDDDEEPPLRRHPPRFSLSMHQDSSASSSSSIGGVSNISDALSYTSSAFVGSTARRPTGGASLLGSSRKQLQVMPSPSSIANRFDGGVSEGPARVLPTQRVITRPLTKEALITSPAHATFRVQPWGSPGRAGVYQQRASEGPAGITRDTPQTVDDVGNWAGSGGGNNQEGLSGGIVGRVEQTPKQDDPVGTSAVVVAGAATVVVAKVPDEKAPASTLAGGDLNSSAAAGSAVSESSEEKPRTRSVAAEIAKRNALALGVGAKNARAAAAGTVGAERSSSRSGRTRQPEPYEKSSAPAAPAVPPATGGLVSSARSVFEQRGGRGNGVPGGRSSSSRSTAPHADKRSNGSGVGAGVAPFYGGGNGSWRKNALGKGGFVAEQRLKYDQKQKADNSSTASKVGSSLRASSSKGIARVISGRADARNGKEYNVNGKEEASGMEHDDEWTKSASHTDYSGKGKAPVDERAYASETPNALSPETPPGHVLSYSTPPFPGNSPKSFVRKHTGSENGDRSQQQQQYSAAAGESPVEGGPGERVGNAPPARRGSVHYPGRVPTPVYLANQNHRSKPFVKQAPHNSFMDMGQHEDQQWGGDGGGSASRANGGDSVKRSGSSADSEISLHYAGDGGGIGGKKHRQGRNGAGPSSGRYGRQTPPVHGVGRSRELAKQTPLGSFVEDSL